MDVWAFLDDYITGLFIKRRDGYFDTSSVFQFCFVLLFFYLLSSAKSIGSTELDAALFF
jgi:hypothetical protein